MVKPAVVCILAGTLLLAGPSFGFSSFAADRGVSGEVVADANANLAVDSAGDIGTLRGDSSPKRAATLTNNLSEDVDVLGFEITNDGNALAVDSPTPGSTIASGTSDDVTLVCAESTSVGVRNVEVEVTEVDGPTTTIRGVSFNVTVDIQCNKGSGSGVVNFSADDIATTNTSQTFSFNADGLKNRDEAYIDLSDPQTSGGVDYTGGTTVVTGSGTATYDAATDRIVYTTSGNPKGTIEIRIDGIDVTGSAGERYTVTYTEQRKGSNNREDSDIFYLTG